MYTSTHLFMQDKPVKKLKQWSVYQRAGNLVLKGCIDDSGEVWTTNAIKKRVHRFEVQTVSGSTYSLIGKYFSRNGTEYRSLPLQNIIILNHSSLLSKITILVDMHPPCRGCTLTACGCYRVSLLH